MTQMNAIVATSWEVAYCQKKTFPKKRPSLTVQAVKFVLLLSRQGKVRLSKWYTTYPQKERAKITRDITPLVLGRALKLCNFLDYQDIKVCAMFPS